MEVFDMDRRRGISETIRYIYNPLPGITEEELVEKTDLDLLNASTRPFFEWRWKYAAGLEMEFVIVDPGSFMALRDSEVSEFLREFAELGAVVIDDPQDEDEVKKAAIKGLTVAHKYWAQIGTKRVVEYRKRHGIGKEDLEDHKYDLWAYYRNQAAADLVKTSIDALRKRRPASKTADPKE